MLKVRSGGEQTAGSLSCRDFIITKRRSLRKSAQKKLSDRCVYLRVRGHLLKNKWLMGELEGFLSGLCVGNILHVEIPFLNTLFIAYRNFVDQMKQKTHSSLITKSPHFYHNGIDYMKKMKFRRTILLATLLQLVVISTAFQSKCLRDSDCGDSHYCTGGICERCIPCQQLFNRQPSSEHRQCAKSETECGSCLIGYQAEELTNQRYSLKCYPVNDEEKSSASNPPLIRWELITSVVIIVALSVAISVFIMCRRKLRSSSTRVDEEKCQHDSLVAHSNPPPYAPSAPAYHDLAWQSQVTVEREVAVQATPLERFHHDRYEEDNNGEQDVLDLGDSNDPPVESDAESVGSTETIPSLWEPGSTPQLNESRPVQMSQTNASQLCSIPARFPLRRSASLDLNERRNRTRPRLSRSDGVVARRTTDESFRGIYSGVHVKLASTRTLNRMVDHSSTPSVEDGYNSDGAPVAATWRFLAVGSLEMEPEPPQPFTFSDQLSEDQRPYRSLFRSLSTTSQAHGGSEDSGIYELNNRRRPAPNDVLEFSLRLSVKRLREDP